MGRLAKQKAAAQEFDQAQARVIAIVRVLLGR